MSMGNVDGRQSSVTPPPPGFMDGWVGYSEGGWVGQPKSREGRFTPPPPPCQPPPLGITNQRFDPEPCASASITRISICIVLGGSGGWEGLPLCLQRRFPAFPPPLQPVPALVIWVANELWNPVCTCYILLRRPVGPSCFLAQKGGLASRSGG